MKAMNRKTALGAGLLSLTVAWACVAQQGAGSATPSGSTSPKAGTATETKASPGKSDARAGDKAARLAGPDREFMMKAAKGGMAEVEMGKMAQDKAQNDAVKQFAQRMVTDHSKSNEELKSLAGSKGVQLPATSHGHGGKEANKMMKLHGLDFDRAYMKHMVADHKKTVADFEKASKKAKDGDVKAFAAKTLPTLQEHYKLAQSTYEGVKNAKGSDARSASAAKGGAPGAAGTPGTEAKGGTSVGSGGAPGSGTSPATGGSGTAGTGVGSSGSTTAREGTRK